ncbi:MAG: PaaI family thioesterase [Acidobacteria bacterium]|nr:PaaI family thioesterase [Acidobacteriota bacterium]
MPLDPENERAIRARLATGLFPQWMGLELVALEEGASEIRMVLQPHHLNPGGIAHGGVIATLLDAAIGIALRTRLVRGTAHVTAQLGVQYLSPASDGSLTARGRAVQSGSRVGFGDGELRSGDGRLLATAQATFLVVPSGSLPNAI